MNPALPWTCPQCNRPAALAPAGTELSCDRGHSFGECDGILCLCDRENYAESFGLEWIEHSATQVDSLNGTHISRDRFFDYTRWPRDLGGERILEAGSGSGRFTEVLLDTGAEVVSFDYSRAVVANHANNGSRDRLTLFRGDILRIPFAPKSFDRVVCIGVLQHTPDPELSFRSLVRMLKPGGQFAVDIYRVAAITLLHPKYHLRPFRKLVPPGRLFSWVQRAVPVLLPIKAAVRRVPFLGVPLAHVFVPVPDYRGRLPLSDAQAQKWSELDLFDWLSPEHDHPVTERTLRRWCREAGLQDVTIDVVSKGSQFAIRARGGG